jgi:hypothetical protein
MLGVTSKPNIGWYVDGLDPVGPVLLVAMHKAHCATTRRVITDKIWNLALLIVKRLERFD